MRSMIVPLALALSLLSATAANAAERTVTLKVDNMTCPTCPLTVRKSLEGVPGVVKAKVDLDKGTAVVTFDDAKADINALTKATTNAGYPSRVVAE